MTETKSPRRREIAGAGNGEPPALKHWIAPGSPEKFRARVRMYRHGLGDCFLITFPREGRASFQMLIDCGALARDKDSMTRVAEHIRDTVLDGGTGKARLDVVVGTHEHKDHLSGFNQAREVFDSIDFGAVWLGWTENLTRPEIKQIKETRKKAIARLQTALDSPRFKASADCPSAARAIPPAAAIFALNRIESGPASAKVADALEYLKHRGKEAGHLKYLEPGAEPLELDGVEGVRVYVLGPPLDPILLKTSKVTEEMKRKGIVYHLSAMGEAGMEALYAAFSDMPGSEEERYYPFSMEKRIERDDGAKFAGIRPFVEEMYDKSEHAWRRIDDDWLSAFDQLALNLDSDTNNTSVAFALEFHKTREVLLFVGDAQVGSWQSWAGLEFKTPDGKRAVTASDLLSRTVFYKVGHHCSHNATLRKGGLELMNHDDLVAFVPLDRETARSQGKKGWEMPAPALYEELQRKTSKRVTISDTADPLPADAADAGIFATDVFIDYFLE